MSAYESTGGGDRIDWEGERRWWDNTWMTTGLTVLTILVVIGLLSLAHVPHDILAPAGTGAIGAFAGTARGRAARRNLAADIDVKPEYIPVLDRRIRKERIPEDPRARHAMDVMAGRRLARVTSDAAGWFLWGLVALCAAGMVMCAVERQWLSGVCLLVVGASTAYLTLTRRRRADRLQRVLHAVAEPGSPFA